MQHILLIGPPGSLVIDEAQRRLSAHFGASRVKLGGDQWRPGDAIVLFFEALPAVWADPVRRQEIWREIDHPWLSQALAAEATLIPVMVDGARMPTPEQLPPGLQPLSFKHALPMRSDVQLPRDVGRLIQDLEAQLQHVVGDAFPLEFWLVPLGVIAVLLGWAYADAYFHDVSEWSFAYQKVDAFRRAAWTLVGVGPALLGAGMLAVTGGLWWRHSRHADLQRAEFYRNGAGELPRPVRGLALGCLCAGAAAIGWSLPAASVAAVLGAAALWSSRSRNLSRGEWCAVALGLAGAALGTAWTVELWRREIRVQLALNQYEAGREEMVAKRPDAAIERWTAATELCPWYANSYYRLAQLHQREDRPIEALATLNKAIELYPTGVQTMFGPSMRIVGQAYDLRAKLHEAAGDADLAQRDGKASSELTPMFNFTGGLFRFWDDNPDADENKFWEDFWGVDAADEE